VACSQSTGGINPFAIHRTTAVTTPTFWNRKDQCDQIEQNLAAWAHFFLKNIAPKFT
jgi:hypothetical protein